MTWHWQGRGCTVRILALLSVLLLTRTGTAAEKRAPALDARMQLGFGHDSNSYREAIATDPGYYLPYDLRARYQPAVGEATQLQLSVRADGDMYMGQVADGSESGFDFDVEYARRLCGSARRQAREFALDFGVQGAAAAKRSTYVSRFSGEEYTHEVNGIPVSLRDRFDRNDVAAGARLGMRWPWSTRWSAACSVRHRNYTQDYDHVPDVERLDNRNIEASIQVTQDIGRPLRLRIRYAHELTDYYDRAVRDLSGARVEGVAQTFSFNTVRADVRCELGKAWGVGLATSWRGRQDPYVGYYDSTTWSIGPEIRVDATRRLGLQIAYEYSHCNYERAHVSFDPTLPLRDDHEQRLFLAGSYRLDPRSSFFLTVDHDNVDEVNPVYTYARTRATAGYELRY